MPEHGRISTIRVQYGLRIKDLRDERGLSQRGFAALIGMSPTYLADIERGARNVSIDNMLFELVGFIMCERFETINDFTAAALREFPEQYREIIVGYNSILERYCRGNYLNAERKRKCVEQSGAKE